MPFEPDHPFNQLPLLPPKVELESRLVLRWCIEAHAALAALDTSGLLIPNEAILINSIPLLEAQASSEIENIVTTTDRLFRHAASIDDMVDPATKETLRYRTALRRGSDLLREKPLSTRTAVEICRIIKGVDVDIRKLSGTALRNDVTGRIVYTPPQGEALLRDLLADWEKFLHGEDDLDPLVRMAVAHYQFEAIHPFTDGNGRTGRILNLLFLQEKGLLTTPVLYLSRYIIAHKADYYRLLLAVTVDGAWEPWILFMLRAVAATAHSTRRKILRIRMLLEDTRTTMRERLPKIYSHELAELIFVRPYCRIGDLVEAGIAKRQAASSYLKRLVEIGILKERKSGRELLFIHPALIDLLTSTDD